MFQPVTEAISVACQRRSRTRPETAKSGKAHSSKPNRALLRAKRIKAVAPEPRDQIANCKRNSGGGRPVDFVSESYKGGAVVYQSFNILKRWRSIATLHDKLALAYRAAMALSSVLIWLRQ